jgi:ELWxxDGT repeat protein
LGCFACLAPAAGSDFVLVADLAPGTEQASLFRFFLTTPEPSVTVGATTLFRGCDEEHGCELWASDGSALGTYLLADVVPGPANGLSTSVEFRALGGLVYFSVYDETRQWNLWRTDGTTLGTEPFVEKIGAPALEKIGSVLWFSGWDEVHGAEPWISDGTLAGTAMLVDVAAGATSSSPSFFVAAGGLVYFSAQSPATGTELYASDGTGAGTFQVADLNAGAAGSFPLQLRAAGGLLVFSADDGTSGRELWRSDGTGGGTLPVADIAPGVTSSSPGMIATLGSEVLFYANDGTTGRELWKTNGNVAQQVLDIRPGSSSSIDSLDIQAARAVMGGFLYFTADDGVSGQELWRSDGTAAGTTLVADTRTGSLGGSPGSFVLAGNFLYYSADDGVHGRELWATNAAGTTSQRLLDLDGTVASSMSERLTGFPGPGGGLLFGAAVNDLGYELWRIDGPAGPAVRLTDVVRPVSSVSNLIPWLDGVAALPFFGPDAHQLVTSGATLGTQVHPFLSGHPFSEMVHWQDLLFLTDEDETLDQARLWAFDGTSETLITQRAGYNTLRSLRSAGSGVVFTNELTLSLTDGTPAANVGDLAVVSAPDVVGARVSVNGDLAYYPETPGYSLWRTDLATGTSTEIFDPTPSVGQFWDPLGFSGNRLFFSVSTPVVGAPPTYEIWSSDGTLPGSVVLPIDDGLAGFWLVEAGGQAIIVQLVDSGWEFYSTDGTVVGTSLLWTQPSGVASPFRPPVAANGWAYMAIDPGIWVSDGTVAGTYMAADTVGFTVHHALGDYCVVSGPMSGRGVEFALLEPLTGTLIPLGEVEPGPASTSVFKTAMVGPTLWASAFRSDTGLELFQLDLSPWLSPPLFGDGFELGDTSAWSSVVP